MKLRSKLGKTKEIEPHHAVPRQFAKEAQDAGVDIEDYVIYMDTEDHRLRPGGLHTRARRWNAQWKAFFHEHPNAKATEIQQQLLRMLRQEGSTDEPRPGSTSDE